MRKLPVAQQIKKLVSYIMAYAAADDIKYGIGEIVKVRK